jgi:hypothetical protein
MSSLARADADLDAIAVRLPASLSHRGLAQDGVNLYPLHTEIVRDYQQILWTLFATVCCSWLSAAATSPTCCWCVQSHAGRSSCSAHRSVHRVGTCCANSLSSRSRSLLPWRSCGAGLAVCRCLLVAPLRSRGLSTHGRNGNPTFACSAFGLVLTVIVALVCAIVPARAAVRAHPSRDRNDEPTDRLARAASEPCSTRS